MRSRARTVLAAALGLWAGAAGAGETVWEGAVRVIDARTLAGAPGGPELPLAGIGPLPPDAWCGPAEERPACSEIAEMALQEMTSGQHVVCERDGDGDRVVCRADEVDVAEWMVRMGWALAMDERLREAQREARATRQGMWWFEEERLLHARDAPPTGFVPPHLPGEDAVRTCARAREGAFVRQEHGNLIGIEAVEWLIEETRLRWERRRAMAGDGAETPPADPETGDTLNAARKLCGALGDGPRADGETAAAAAFEGEIESIEREVARAADESRETCWKTAAGAARRGEVEILAETRQIARHTMLRTERLGERLWQAKERKDEDEARQALGLAHAAFGNAGRRCRELAVE